MAWGALTVSHKPFVVYCLCELECPLYQMVREAYIHALDAQHAIVGGPSESMGANVSLAARVLRVNLSSTGYTELWVRVSGKRMAVECFEKLLRRAKGVYFQEICSNKFSRVLRMLVSKERCRECTSRSWCQTCPLIDVPVGAMAKTTVVIPRGVLYEFIVARKTVYEEIQRYNCKPILVHSIEEYDYMLTERQEYALITAYIMGYYGFPRKISLKDLAAKLGLSVSTLAELLRRAEAKVVDAFVRHELPHYIAENVLNRIARQAPETSTTREEATHEQKLATLPA